MAMTKNTKKMKIKKNQKKNFKKTFFSIFLVIIFSIIIFIVSNKEEQKFSFIIVSENKSDYETYINNKYNFAFDYPKGWKVYEDFEKVSPIINIYKEKLGSRPPYDYLSDTSVVSIYPKGQDARGSGVFGQKKDLKLDFIDYNEIIPILNKKEEYILENGNSWAIYLDFENYPDSWKSWGFVWASVNVSNKDYSCKRNGIKISIDECNPIESDEFIRIGNTDLEEFEELFEIIKSIRFIK